MFERVCPLNVKKKKKKKGWFEVHNWAELVKQSSESIIGFDGRLKRKDQMIIIASLFMLFILWKINFADKISILRDYLIPIWQTINKRHIITMMMVIVYSMKNNKGQQDFKWRHGHSICRSNQLWAMKMNTKHIFCLSIKKWLKCEWKFKKRRNKNEIKLFQT